MTKKTTSQTPNQGIDLSHISLREVIAPLFRQKRLAILAFVVVFALANVLAWGWAAHYYSASMQVVVEQDRSDPTITAGQNAAVVNRGITIDQVTSEVALLQGKDMLRTVAGVCGLAEVTPSYWDKFFPVESTLKQAMVLDAVTARLARKLKVEAATTSDVIDVKYSMSGDPKTPACILDSLSKLYLEKHLRLRRPSGTTEFFAKEAEKYRKALAESEARLADFSRREGTGAPDLLRTATAQQLAEMQAGLHHAEQAIEADKQRILSITHQMSATPARSAATEVSNSANVLMQNLQATLLAAQLKRTQLVMKYAPDYPLVREADQEIAATESAIAKAQQTRYVNQTVDRDLTYEFLRQDLAKSEADLASDKANAKALTLSIQSVSTQLVKLNDDTTEQAALMRDMKTNEANYLLYVNKREQERTSDALDQKKFANVAIAVPPTVPATPAYNPVLFVMVGFVLAMISSFAVAYTAEYLDPSIRTPHEAMHALGIQVLASFGRRAT